MPTSTSAETLNPFDPVWRADPYPLYARLREAGEIVRTEKGFWVVARSSAVNAVLRDPARFSSQSRAVRRGLRVGSMASALGETVQTADPPGHTPLRTLLAGPFRPRRVAAMTAIVEGVVAGLVADLAEAGSADFAAALAYELPLRVITDMLGVPAADRHLFRPWSAHFALAQGRRPAPEVLAAADTSMDECLSYLAGLAERRSAVPADDVLSLLLSAEEDGAGLTRRQVLVNTMLMVVAGHETTANLLTNGLHAFLAHPRQWALLCADPGLAAGAVDEILRYDCPVQLVTRMVAEPTTFAGHDLAVDESVVVALGAANRDPATTECPDTFDIRRRGSGHSAFGAGRHYCLGAPLALIEARVALCELARAFPGITADGEPVRLTSETVRGFGSYPVRVR